MIVFSDVDGCITTNTKLNVNVNTGLPLRLGKSFSDKDCLAIDILRDNKIQFVLITGDDKINIGWAEKHKILLHYEPKDKWAFIQKRYWQEIEKPWVYIGDAMPDFDCLKNATYPFVPADASKILLLKLQEAGAPPTQLKTCGGGGVIDDVVARLYEMGLVKI